MYAHLINRVYFSALIWEIGDYIRAHLTFAHLTTQESVRRRETSWKTNYRPQFLNLLTVVLVIDISVKLVLHAPTTIGLNQSRDCVQTPPIQSRMSPAFCRCRFLQNAPRKIPLWWMINTQDVTIADIEHLGRISAGNFAPRNIHFRWTPIDLVLRQLAGVRFCNVRMRRRRTHHCYVAAASYKTAFFIMHTIQVSSAYKYSRDVRLSFQRWGFAVLTSRTWDAIRSHC